jgi:hypothetical protein
MTKSAIGVAMLLLTASPLLAATYQSSSFLPGPINLTFDTPAEIAQAPANATLVTNQFQAEGVDFSGIYYNPVGPDPGTPNNSGNNVGDFAAFVPAINPHFIDFVNPTTGLPQVVTSADFSLASQPATATITALLAGVPVEQFTPATNLAQTNNIFGFTGIAFDSISISITPDPDAQTQDHADLIDNIQFQLVAVPEPSSFVGLLGLGATGLFFAARRRKPQA